MILVYAVIAALPINQVQHTCWQVHLASLGKSADRSLDTHPGLGIVLELTCRPWPGL